MTAVTGSGRLAVSGYTADMHSHRSSTPLRLFSCREATTGSNWASTRQPVSRCAGWLVACLLWMITPVCAGELEVYPEVGPTPPLALRDLGGNTHTLDGYRGQVVLLNFWATWCPPCLLEMPSLQRLQAALPDAALTVLAVNVKEPREQAWRFRQLLKIRLTVLLDTTGQAAEDWNVAVYPTSYLIDRTGRIRYVAYGALDWDSPEVREVVAGLQQSDGQPQVTQLPE